MSNWEIVALVFACIVAYGLGAGATASLFRKHVEEHTFWYDPWPFFACALFPVALPALLAYRLLGKKKPPLPAAKVVGGGK